MKIGIDARMYGPAFTGIGRYTSELIKNLARLDSKNRYTVFLRKQVFDDFQAPGPNFEKALADFPHYSFGEQIGFLKLLNASRLDLMHFTHFNAPIFYRRPSVVTIHDLTLSFFPGKKMTNFFHRLGYHVAMRSVTRHAKAIIAVSRHTKADIEKAFGIPSEKITVIYNGVSDNFGGTAPTSRTDLMQKFGISRPYFLYTGVWRDHKNVVGMVKAFAELNKEMGGQYNLVITGRYNPAYREIPDTIRELKLENDVPLVGLVADSDLLALYKNAIAYVFPSFYEGFGLPPLEAMQCGTPVVASNTSAIPEVCGEGNALYFDPYDLKDIKDKMKLIATDPIIRQRLIEHGKEHVKGFGWDKMAMATLGVYQSMQNSL
ncbi:glycosyltransferase family 4 protein [Candidatus Peregrinibacteria bacterium]|nr:glycosyltransferase family 4 protein [Candidatus Peregrinibacteria bacterium]